MTAQAHADYTDLLQVWQEADAHPQIEHCWLFDHLMPIGGDPFGPVLEGWTVLAALAAQTRRVRVGVMVTSNRLRPPALLAKIAATVDQVSGGRLDFGIGVGSRPGHPLARREYAAHGIAFNGTASAVTALAESLEVVRSLWTEDAPFDYRGEQIVLHGAYGSPKPLQSPHPPILIGGRSDAVLRIAARHANIWNHPGADLAQALERSRQLTELCHETGRDPVTLLRSIPIPFDHRQPSRTRRLAEQALEAGFSHIVLGLAPPYPDDAVSQVVERVIAPLSGTSTTEGGGHGVHG